MFDQSKLERFYQDWQQKLVSVRPSDRQKAARALKRIASFDSSPEPYIIHCRNPFEFAVLPSLLLNCLSSIPWQRASEHFLSKKFKKDKWEKEWDACWASLYAQYLVPLLRDMVRPMPDADQLVSFVPALSDSLKDCLATHLQERIPQLSDIEQSSSKAVGLWSDRMALSIYAQSKAEAFLKIIMEEYESSNNKWTDELRRRNQIGKLRQLNQQQLQIEERGRQFSNACRTTVQRFGSAAAAQLQRAVWLPGEVSWLSAGLRWDEAAEDEYKSAQSASKELLNAWLDLMESCGGFVGIEKLCFILDNPLKIACNEQGFLHSANGAAMIYPGNFEVYAWNGTTLPAFVVNDPAQITLETINSERNAAVRRVMIEKFGLGKYVLQLGARIIHEDEFGKLYRCDKWGVEPMLLVKVVNSTPEPDGTHSEYFLRVPPNMERAKQAVAWTFGFDEDDYGPKQES